MKMIVTKERYDELHRALVCVNGIQDYVFNIDMESDNIIFMDYKAAVETVQFLLKVGGFGDEGKH